MNASSTLSSSIEQVLRHHAIPALRLLDIEETDEAVILSGSVSSYYLKQLAQEAVLPLLSGRLLANRVVVVRGGS